MIIQQSAELQVGLKEHENRVSLTKCKVLSNFFTIQAICSMMLEI